MAVDEALLAAAVDDDVATLRLYQWNEPTLSLGYFQRYDDRHQHAASRDCAVVRRQSGGGAILHDRELTYSLTLPPGHPLTRDATALYTAVHNAFIELLSPHLTEAQSPKWRLALNRCESQLARQDEPFLCFQRRACGDLLLTPASANCRPLQQIRCRKRIRFWAVPNGGIAARSCSTAACCSRSPAAPELPGWRI